MDYDGSTIGNAVTQGLVSFAPPPLLSILTPSLLSLFSLPDTASALANLPLPPHCKADISQLQHRNQLDYFTSSASSYPTTQDVIDNMLDEQVWAAITINSGATSNLQTARQNGDSSYNGSSAISIYYAQARNEMAMNQYVVTYIQQALGKITAQIGAESVAN